MKILIPLALLSLVPLPSWGQGSGDWNVSGSIENTLWLANGVPPAFLEFDGDTLYDPRLSLTVDYQPDPRFFFHATLTADRGFDPGTQPDDDVRLDELIMRYRPLGDGRLNIQLGKFPTVVGNWIPTHDFYDDPFLLPPLPYAAINGVNLKNPIAHAPAAIESRLTVSGATIHNFKENWSSLIWGPAYSNGISIFGSNGKLDYALEWKNAALGNQPDQWDFGDGDFRTPNLAARLGYRPDAAWTIGLSAAYGHYLNENATVPIGRDRDDFTQTLVGLDLRWSHHDWIVSGEVFYSTYETLAQDFHSLSYYLQARYKATPRLWLACRFGQTISNEVRIPSGNQAPWSPDLFRTELALGWRLTPDLLFKTQYTYTEVTTEVSEPTQHLGAFSLGWRF